MILLLFGAGGGWLVGSVQMGDACMLRLEELGWLHSLVWCLRGLGSIGTLD